MKMIALVLIAAAGGLLSSCIAYEVPVAGHGASHDNRGGPPDRYHDGMRNHGDGDRDRDGVPDRRDRALDNPYRY
jgi:hypothetical protein